jgi:transcriptional regulator with XRE-family HTH domain
MGHSRPRPKHLAKKVLQIRRSLGISQGEMVKRLGVEELIDHTTISKYELDKNEPPLAVLLAYARLVGIPAEQIIDDELDLIILNSARAPQSFSPAINFHTSGHGRVDVELTESLPLANSITQTFADPTKERYLRHRQDILVFGVPADFAHER